MMTEEAEEDDVKVSVCLNCARHQSLKRIIEADSTIGLCAICCNTKAIVRNPANAEPMIMLIRALVRFYWDESDYNSHWGGDGLLKLFSDPENPLFVPFSTHDYSDEFDHLLQWPPYPDWDKGISIYAGFDDGVRLLNFAISRSQPNIIRNIRSRLNADNFSMIEPELHKLLDSFIDELKIILPTGGTWFRAREGIEAVFERVEWSDVRLVRQPYMGANIGASPYSSNGRLNRAGHPVLYLGSTPYTALAEIRPHPGHYVSIGGFETTKELNVADFDPDITPFATNEVRLALYEIINSFDRLMSTPVPPNDKVGYLITQLLAEALKSRGFDGVQFRSSVSDGVNLCLFDPSSATFVDQYSAVHFIESVRYEAPERPSLTTPGPSDYKV